MIPSRTPEVRTAAAVRPTAVPTTPKRARTWVKTQAKTDDNLTDQMNDANNEDTSLELTTSKELFNRWKTHH